MDKKGRSFRKRLTTKFFEETDLRKETQEKEPQQKGRMHKGVFTVTGAGESKTYMKKGEIVEGYIPASSVTRFGMRVPKGSIEEMRKSQNNKRTKDKKIVGYLFGATLILGVIGAMAKPVYGKPIDETGITQQVDEDQRDFISRLDKDNLSNEELKNIIKAVIYDLEYNKIKFPLCRHFNVSSDDITINYNPITITIKGEYYRDPHGGWHVKENDTQHEVDSKTAQLVMKFKRLQEILDSKGNYKLFISEIRGIVGELPKEEISFVTDGYGRIIRDMDGINKQIEENLDYIDRLKKEQSAEQQSAEQQSAER